MKRLKKLSLVMLAFVIIVIGNPLGASAAWKKDTLGWWYTEDNSYATGWRLINGNWYYFYSDGYMASDTIIDGYYLNSSGAWSNSAIYMSSTEAEEKVRQYLINAGEYVPSIIEYDHEENNAYVIHCYDIIVDHTATSGWYYVDKTTGNITSMF